MYGSLRDDLTRTLDEPQRAGILALWQEYEDAATPEAQAVKALDKLETLLQHTQGQNPPDFDYAFNLQYGKRYTDAAPLFAELRALIAAPSAMMSAKSAAPSLSVWA